ncbi:hypothetical protein LY76DRAFT_6352 [Colletotrichum caudatum]|nr:hypothetical protein LY76DRAFT_6352 [Colletotrichum caudatum]
MSSLSSFPRLIAWCLPPVRILHAPYCVATATHLAFASFCAAPVLRMLFFFTYVLCSAGPIWPVGQWVQLDIAVERARLLH